MTHYVYLLNSKTQEKYYIGARSCKCSISEDTYMGSSSVMTKDDKANCNKIILKRFKTRKEAIQYEIELHEKFNVASNTLFWNKSKQTSTGFDTTGMASPNKGKKLQQYQIDALREGRKKYKITPEHRERLSKASKGIKRSPEFGKAVSEGLKGNKLTEEHKKAISNTWYNSKTRGVNMSKAKEGLRGFETNRAKRANIYDYSTGNIIATRVCIAEWCRDTVYNNSALCSTARGRTKQHKNIYARYIND